MYKRIMVPLENTRYDQIIIDHVRALARMTGSSVVVIHVADGFVARNFKQMNLRESEEMRLDREYVERIAAELTAEGIDTEPILGGGDPATEIVAAAEREGCDLIAMATHGHRGLADLVHGSTANEVRHLTRIPVLMVRAKL